MQTQYNVNNAVAVEGQTVGPREASPYTLPYLAQVSTLVIADASPAAGEAWTVTFTDDDSSQQYPLTFDSGATLDVTLDNLVDALNADGKLRDLFTVSEDGVDTATFTARKANQAFTITSAPGGSATGTHAVTTAAGGAELELGTMVSRSATAGEMRALEAADTADNLAGILFRTDTNHFHDLENDTASAVDSFDRGRTLAVMEEGRCWVLVPTGVSALTDAVHVRVNAGRLGEFRNAADGGDTVDVSAFCRWESTAGANGLALLRIIKQG